MPQPTSRDLHVDALLTQISIAYVNPTYIADFMFPQVPVNKRSDKIPAYDQSPWYRDDMRMRAPGTKSRGGGFTVNTTATYYCDRFSRRFEIPDEVRENADAPFNLDADATRFLTDKAMMRREVAFATDFFTTGKWGADKTGGTDFTQWSTYGSSTPLLDIDNYKDAVEAGGVPEPNTFAMGKQAWLITKHHPDLVDRIKYTQRAQITTEIASALFEIPNFLVGRSIYTATVEGTAESSVVYSRIWGKNGLLMFRPPAPSLLTPAAGYTFVWRAVANALQYIKRMRDEEREIDIVEINSFFDQKITAAKAGLFMSGVVA